MKKLRIVILIVILISRFATFSPLYLAAEVTAPLKVGTKCTTPSLIPTVNGNTVRNFPTHGQLSAAQGSPTTVSAFDIR
jgi:hypothetical protein